jgi:hypothetical protein
LNSVWRYFDFPFNNIYSIQIKFVACSHNIKTMSSPIAVLFEEVENLTSLPSKVRWYSVLIVTLSAMNYPDYVPHVWEHLSSHYLPLVEEDEKLLTARKIREALTKSVGIVGAAKVMLQILVST